MARETITPKDEAEWLALRTKDVTSTEISALFGCSPYSTLFEVWTRKKTGQQVELADNERMAAGRHFQESIATFAAKRRGWKIKPFTDYMRGTELRIGSSFDYRITGVEGDDPSKWDQIDSILEVKNVDGLAFKQGWIENGADLEAPAHIELQVQHQLLVSGLKRAYIAALVGGNTLKIIERLPDPKVQKAIRETVKGFWASIESGHMPEPNLERDAAFIHSLYSHAEPGKVMLAHGNVEIQGIVEEYRKIGDEVSALDKKKDALKAKILMLIGDHEKCVGDGYVISAGISGPTRIEAYERKGFRQFRISWKGVKA